MRRIYFAAGGTGGHIYPAIAVAEEILKMEPSCKITFFCSQRPVDARIYQKSGFHFIPLPARGFSKNPLEFFLFLKSLFASRRIVRQVFEEAGSDKKVVLSVGGFVSVPVMLAAASLKIPSAMLNIDSVPGKANKLLARYARDIFVQFEDTKYQFGSNARKVITTGCPLRQGFFKPDRNAAIRALNLSPRKKILLITGASGGSANINNVICYLLDRLAKFADDWQIVHLTGIAHFDTVKPFYDKAEIEHTILDYFDDMPALLAAAELVVGRAGAMSVAEFVASGRPAICLPYPYHGDKHQRLNARYLVEAGCGWIVDDLCDTEKTAELLWPVLCELMSSDRKRREASENCKKLCRATAAALIAKKLLDYH